MTTLELAEAIVRAVDAYAHEDAKEAAKVVLKVLHDNGAWFCRVVETEVGTQQSLFPKV